MAMYCSRYCCFLALVLIISAQGMEVVARVHFSQANYIVMEDDRICVDIVNDMGPASEGFSVSFSFSTSLIGSGSGGALERFDIVTFPANSDTAQLCFPHINDLIPCEANINGTLRLNDNSAVEIIEPSSAIVIIQDNDYISAQFENSYYSVMEGQNDNEEIIISASNSIDLIIRQASNVEQLLLITSPEVSLSEGQNTVELSIPDDNIALQDTRAVTLHLAVPSESSCNVQMPRNKTTILIMDDDIVTVELTSNTGRVKEGEGYWICISLSGPIARQIDLLLDIQAETADLADLEITSLPVTFTPNSEPLECVQIVATQDDVIENDETFRVQLSLQTVLPPSLQNNLIIGMASSTITIEDTSTCTGVSLDPSNTHSAVYIHERRTLCFSCKSCIVDIFWNITSYQGHKWTGRTGENLQSESNVPNVGQVLPNGTLLLINSSSVFSRINAGIVRFNEIIQGNQDSYEYNIIVGEEAYITELKIIERNGSIQFVCQYRGTPEPQLDWQVNSRPIKEEEILGQVDEKGEEMSQSTLFINRTIAEKYVFTCVVSNPFGSDSSDGSILVQTPKTISAGTLVSLYYSMYIFVSAILLCFLQY